jgi:hypothetical protein
LEDEFYDLFVPSRSNDVRAFLAEEGRFLAVLKEDAPRGAGKPVAGSSAREEGSTSKRKVGTPAKV